MYCLSRITLLIEFSQYWMDGCVGMIVILQCQSSFGLGARDPYGCQYTVHIDETFKSFHSASASRDLNLARIGCTLLHSKEDFFLGCQLFDCIITFFEVFALYQRL